MTTSQDKNWKHKEQGDEANYIRQKEQEQLRALQTAQAQNESTSASKTNEGTVAANQMDKEFEGGFGGQEDLEDRYATTSGEH